MNEILKEIDSTNDLQKLIDIWNSIANNKYKYSLDEIDLVVNKIKETVLKSNGSDFDKGRFFFALNQMFKPKSSNQLKQK